MMKLKTLAIMIAATTAAFTACTENDSQQQQMMPITLTSQIATTRSFTPTQENHLVSGQKLYVWANREATEGTANWTQNAYLKAWTLTADGSGALTGSTKYYPPQTLSMVALHGNFSFTEDTDVFPGTVQHSVLTDQSTEENYAKSDLLYWKALGQSAEASKAVTLGHKLSKIEIHLSGNGYTEDDIDQMELTLNNVLPTASLDLTDGTLSQAYGTAVSIKPYKTNKVDYEAIIPPQQKPLDFITVTLNGTVVKIDAQVTGFDENTRYPYNLDMTYRDVRKNPLWYVAEYNVNYDGSSTYSWATTPDEGYFFSWADAFTAASKFDGWHLPVLAEWWSIVPGNSENIFGFDTGSGTYKASNVTVKFGYSDETQSGIADVSYWKKISDAELHALRYLGTEYCSAWKYVWTNNMLMISATLIDNVTASSDAASAWYTANWNKVYFGNDEARGAVHRCWYARGEYTGGSGSTSNFNTGIAGYYWLATAASTNGTNADFRNGQAKYASNTTGNGFPIRLFRGIADIVDVVDMGTGDGLLWAVSNVGASLPADYGNYYEWGATAPYPSSPNANTTWSTSNPWAWLDYTGVLPLSNDIAYLTYGGKYRVPTKAEFDNLIAKCNWNGSTYMTNSDGQNIRGYTATSKTNGNQIFIPMGGIYEAGAQNKTSVGSISYLWSATSLIYNSSAKDAWDFNNAAMYSNYVRAKAMPIRAVYDANK